MSNTFKTISNDELVTATGGYGGLGGGLGGHPIAALNNQLATLNANNNNNNSSQTTNMMMMGMAMAMANRPRYY